MKKGQKLRYVGKGFIGFHPHFTEMEFISNEGLNDYWVNYKGSPQIKGRMLVRKWEVELV